MHLFEWILALVAGALVLAAISRRIGAPYPALLAVGGIALALTPGAPVITIDPDLILALFIAPVLLDAAYDTSPRDLKRDWPALTSLAVGVVIATTVAVAFVARRLVPDMPLAVALALGAIVAPTDAIAATVVLRPLKPPHRLITLIEGEGLFNDATALIIYRVAVATAVSGAFMPGGVAVAFVTGVIGGVVLGVVLAKIGLALLSRVKDLPTQIIAQFVMTFFVWLIAERIGVSPVLTLVANAITLARTAPARNSARQRLPSYAVWEVVVFLLNVLAFSMIGLQLRPYVKDFDVATNLPDLRFALAILATCVVVRFAWVAIFVTARQLVNIPGPLAHIETGKLVRQALVIVWSGMRGVITIATALALPAANAFPYRDLVILSAFTVVIGSLVVQGLTLKPLLLLLDLHDDDPVGRETAMARRRAWQAAIDSLDGDTSDAAEAVRSEYRNQIAANEDEALADSLLDSEHAQLRRQAVSAARVTILELRRSAEIGDDAFHRLEEELDYIEISAPERD